MINFGDWQNMPDYREGWQDKHKSGIARLGTMFDPTNYIPGVNAISKPIHNMAEQGADMGNRILSPVVGAAQKFTEATTPGMKQVQNAVPMIKGIDSFIRNKPVDALAIAAATFFSGGAVSGAGSSLGAAGNAAATSAITPTFASGNAAGGALAATPGMASGAASITPALSGTAAVSTPGILGASGTAALESAIPATYSGLAASMPAQGLLNTFATRLKPLRAAKRYADNFRSFAGNEGLSDQDRMNALSDNLAQNILNSNNPPTGSIKMRRF